MFLAHLVHTLGPWYARIEQSANAALLTPRERASGLYTKFVAQGLMRADARAQAEYISRMVLNGIMTRNEARGLLEMNPLAGLDEPLTPVNTDVGTTNANDAAPAPQQQEPQR
jgi:phage portal protein BeeE